MRAGDQFGPFRIEKELGAGAMGVVCRARYIETDKVVAIKVMAPGLGDTNPNAVARFKREADILKQLHHPNIVGLFGVGKCQGTRYYAMEYVQGESLDRVMARRGRMTWEEVVELGQQLCSALQHAHEAGVVHRDLKPSNLMILPDGTLKLTDFGIAKDLDVTGLTSANCTVGTASYMSPEQCKGERDITPKSDLYSLGIVFYELITGRKPFNAENAMDMFMMHVQGEFERPSRLVMDVPVWLDNLICQLMEKKPEHRPMDAAMVGKVLGSIQEKVEAQQSAGVDAVRARSIDRPRDARNPDEKDKEAARALMTGKKGKRKRKTTPFYQRLWFVAPAAVALLAGFAALLWFCVQPKDPATLYKEAKTLMGSPKREDHEKAYADDGPIKTYLAHYASQKTGETDQMLAWKQQCDVEDCEDQLQALLKRYHKGFNSDPATDAEGQAKKAALAEEDGDLTEAQRQWQDMTQKYGPGSGQESWGALAANHLTADQAVPDREKQLLVLLKQMHDTGREPPLDGMDKEAFTALRYEHFGDLLNSVGDLRSAYNRFDDMKEKSSKEPDLHFWEVFAAWKGKALKDRLPKDEDLNARKKLVGAAVTACQQGLEQGGNLTAVRAVASDIVALYSEDSDLKVPVDQAHEVLRKLAGKPVSP